MTAASRAGALALAVVLLAGCGGERGKVTEEELPRTVLQPADVGRGFERFDEGRVIAAEDPLGEGGWKARYRRRDPEAEGVLVVEARVDRYESADAAEAGLREYRERFGAMGSEAEGARSFDVDGLGQETTALTFLQPGTRPVRFYLLAWHTANVTAFLSVNGFERSLTLEQVVGLARKQERRIEEAASD